MIKVYYAQPVYGEEEISEVVRALRNPLILVNGPCVKHMEQRVAGLFGKRFGVMVNSGSSANALAVSLLGLPAGSEVITPALTFSTTVAPVVQQGLVPVFIDVELETFNIDAAKIEQMITPATRGMMIPNLLGNLPDWTELRAIADRHGLIVIEDSADTIGSRYDGVPTGQLADISTTSFYATHIITCAGVGGMACLNDESMYERALILRGWGRSSAKLGESEQIEDRFNVKVDGIPYDRKYLFEEIGFNYLPSEAAAAFGLVQLSKLADFTQRRRENFEKLRRIFQDYGAWFILPRQRNLAETVWLAFPLIVRDDAPFGRTELQIYLEEQGIQTRTVFTGNILRQPGFKGIRHRADPDGYPNADYIMRGGLLLGCHHGMTDDQIDYVAEIFRLFAGRY